MARKKMVRMTAKQELRRDELTNQLQDAAEAMEAQVQKVNSLRRAQSDLAGLGLDAEKFAETEAEAEKALAS